MLHWCICVANREGSRECHHGIDGGNVDFAELHLGFMYGAHKISNLED